MKKRHYNDLEPRMSYDSRQKRLWKRSIRSAFVALLLIALVVFLAIRFGKLAVCAEAGGFFEASPCNGNRCCETVRPVMVHNHVTL